MIFSFNDSIQLTMFGFVKAQNVYWHKGRRLAKHMLLFLSEGSFTMQIGEEMYTAHAGDMLFIPKNTHYIPLDEEQCSYYFFHFDAVEVCREETGAVAVSTIAKAEKYCSYFYGDDCACTTVQLAILSTPLHRQELLGILSRAAKLDLLNNRKHKLLLDAYFREFLATLENAHDTEKHISRTTVKIVQYISDNIRAPLSLGILADAFYLSESHIAKLFRQEMGESVGKYITEQKIRLACALLENSDMSISDIAEHLSFSSRYYFTKVFEKIMHIPPAAFRKQHM